MDFRNEKGQYSGNYLEESEIKKAQFIDLFLSSNKYLPICDRPDIKNAESQ